MSVMSFWRMVRQGGDRLVRWERSSVGEVRPEDPPPRAVRRVYLEAGWPIHPPRRMGGVAMMVW